MAASGGWVVSQAATLTMQRGAKGQPGSMAPPERGVPGMVSSRGVSFVAMRGVVCSKPAL